LSHRSDYLITNSSLEGMQARCFVISQNCTTGAYLHSFLYSPPRIFRFLMKLGKISTIREMSILSSSVLGSPRRVATVMEPKADILPRRIVPSSQNRSLRADRPLSCQLFSTRAQTRLVNNYGYPEPGIQARCFINSHKIINAYLYSIL